MLKNELHLKSIPCRALPVHMHGRLYIRFQINYMQIHPDIHNQIKFINHSAINITLCRKPEALLMRAILPRPLKIHVGVLGQHEDGGSEYLIRKN